MKRKEKSLRQLARELGVSHSYLSQVKHGKQDKIAVGIATCYNLDVLGNRLAVGQRALDPPG